MENLTEEERRLILPMMKNYFEKYTPAGDFEKAKKRVLVRGDLQKMIGETQGPVSRTYLRRDGKILVKLDKIMYGFKEAAYWWNVTLTKVFLENGYKLMSKDKCVFAKSENNQISYCAITVDDGR